jgi:hypothetical protein
MRKGNLLKLSLILPQTTDDLFLQVLVQVLEGVAGVESLEDSPLVEDQNMVLAPLQMFGKDLE